MSKMSIFTGEQAPWLPSNHALATSTLSVLPVGAMAFVVWLENQPQPQAGHVCNTHTVVTADESGKCWAWPSVWQLQLYTAGTILAAAGLLTLSQSHLRPLF